MNAPKAPTADGDVTKWAKLCPAVARSLEEGGAERVTFFNFRKSAWRSLRTTNPLETFTREFRRRDCATILL